MYTTLVDYGKACYCKSRASKFNKGKDEALAVPHGFPTMQIDSSPFF